MQLLILLESINAFPVYHIHDIADISIWRTLLVCIQLRNAATLLLAFYLLYFMPFCQASVANHFETGCFVQQLICSGIIPNRAANFPTNFKGLPPSDSSNFPLHKPKPYLLLVVTAYCSVDHVTR